MSLGGRGERAPARLRDRLDGHQRAGLPRVPRAARAPRGPARARRRFGTLRCRAWRDAAARDRGARRDRRVARRLL